VMTVERTLDTSAFLPEWGEWEWKVVVCPECGFTAQAMRPERGDVWRLMHQGRLGHSAAVQRTTWASLTTFAFTVVEQ
jgi:hypothetical protein